MMEEDSEVFEITDFTTASDWERFVSKLEEVLHEWKLLASPPSAIPPLNKDALSKGEWTERLERIQFADFHFYVKHHALVLAETEDDEIPASNEPKVGVSVARKTVELKVDEMKRRHVSKSPTPGSSGDDDTGDDDEDDGHLPLPLADAMAMENDFPSKCHCLARWHGLREFVSIQPASVSDAILQDSKANILLSSVAMAVNNANCRVPVFVQTQEWRKQFYVGWCESPGVRINYEMIYLQRVPRQYGHLSGLLEIFKEKICQFNSSIPVPPVVVSVRFTHNLDLEAMSARGFWPQDMPDVEIGGEDSVGIQDFSVLPFGPIEDPVRHLMLSTTWPQLSEHLVTETESYSDLDPLQAPQWTARAILTDSPTCLLGESLKLFIDACSSLTSTDQLLSHSSPTKGSGGESQDIAQALQRVTAPSSPIEDAVSRVSLAVTQQASRLSVRHLEAPPIPETLVNRILWFLFPDARPDDYEPCQIEMEEIPTLKWAKAKEFAALTKASPLFSSLTHRLALTICAVNYGFKGGLQGVAFLWREFCLELRYRWEHSLAIPLLQRSVPDMGSCLLHQKLQLLNCCIERKVARERLQLQQSSHGTPAKQQQRRKTYTSDDSEDDDDFYECSESLDDYSFISSPTAENLPNDVDEGEGKLRPCDDLKLLHHPERNLFVPITQDPSPMTEDMLQEHAEVLTQLGSGPEGAHLRAQMQSASLLSDMEAFKAANPGCVLEDFVRWYSPRDFVDQEEASEDGGRLSARMSVEGNIWIETWSQARAVPAKRQRRLFDDTREAEKILYYLTNLKPGEACRLLLPCLLQASVVEIHERAAGIKGDIPQLSALLEAIVARAIAATRASSHDVNLTRPTDDVKNVDNDNDDDAGGALKLSEEVVGLISAAETTIARAQSLRFKLQDSISNDPEALKEIDRFVFQLLENSEVMVPGAARGHVGLALRKLMTQETIDFDDGQGGGQTARRERPQPGVPAAPPSTIGMKESLLFPPTTAKEYIFRVQVPRPSLFSRCLPQRMFAVVVPTEFRIAGAFAQDTVFF